MKKNKWILLITGIVMIVKGVEVPLWAAEAKQKQKPSFRPLFEISATGSFSRSDYGNGSYSISRRYSGSLGVWLLPVTEIEGSYTEASSFTKYAPYPTQTTKTEDRIISGSINQTLVPPTWFFRPYIRVGGARLKRKQQSTYNGTSEPEATSVQPSGLLGAGVRIFFTQSFALKIEVTSYLPHFQIRAAKQNYDWEAGLSVNF